MYFISFYLFLSNSNNDNEWNMFWYTYIHILILHTKFVFLHVLIYLYTLMYTYPGYLAVCYFKWLLNIVVFFWKVMILHSCFQHLPGGIIHVLTASLAPWSTWVPPFFGLTVHLPLLTLTGNHVSKGNHPQMALNFSLVKQYNWPRYMLMYFFF